MKNLFVLLSENGRLGETAGVIQGFNELAAKYKGELNVTVISAAPLPEDVPNRLEATAHAEAKHNRELNVTATSAAPLPKDVHNRLEAAAHAEATPNHSAGEVAEADK